MVSALLRAYQCRVPAVLQTLGAVHWRARRVHLVDLDVDRVEAIVLDQRKCQVYIDDYERAGEANFSCSCRSFQSFVGCQHIWATLLEVDQFLAGLDATEEGYIDADGAVVARSAPTARAPRKEPGAAQPQHDWRRRLQRFVSPLPLVRAEQSLPVLEYHVEPGSEGADVGLTVHVRARYQKKNGQLGVPRTALVPRALLERLSVADRTLLAMWDRDRRADRYNGYGFHGYSNGDVRLAQPWPVRRDTMPVVLPWLAATARVFLGHPQRALGPPRRLQFDIDQPFRFEIVYAPPSSPGKTVGQVRGLLRRGPEVLENVRPGAGLEHGFVFVGDRLVRVDCAGAQELALELGQRGPVEVPAAEAGELLGALARIPGARQFLAAAIEHLPVSLPIGVLSLLLPTSMAAPVTARLHFDYAGTSVSPGEEQPLVADADGARRRDFVAEQQLSDQVLAAGLRATTTGTYECERAKVPQLTATLCAAGLRVLAEGKRLRPFVGGKGNVRSGLDWLEVGGEVEFDGHAANFPELLRRKVTPDGFIELGDGSFGLLPERWLRRVEALRLLGGETDGDVVRLPNSQALLLDAMLEARDGDAFAVDRKFSQLQKRLASFRSVVPATEPASFRGELRPYQRHGLGWLRFLREFGLGGCLADDMGLGKTVQVLAHLADLQENRKRNARASLLVAPRSVLPNWLAEAERFAPRLRVLDFSQPDRWQRTPPEELVRHDLVLTTYAIVRADAVQFAEHELRFHYAILDESQVAKNADSQTSKAVRLLRADHRLALTGTPVENHLGELWSLFEFLNPGMLGRLPAFRALFGKDLTDETMAQHRELVQRALRPVLLRRTKAQVLTDLPDKVEQTLWCDLEPAQRRRYDELRSHYRARLLAEGGELGNDQRFVVLEALLRLRQAACHEGLLDPQRRSAASAKLETLLPRLEELAEEGHKVLVFSQFTSFLDLVEPELRQRGIVFERLDGQTRDRAARVQRFQEDAACPVFLISLKAGGFGLNLTAADYVFVLDPWWNPAAEMQAIDRAHRIGQKRTVHAYRLVCRGTVEERVLELQAQKRALCEAILGNERSLLQDMTRGDLELLLG